MPKNNYWLTDGYGSKALVEGADERDRWKPLGWSEADEPAVDDMVWMEHEQSGGRQRFAAGVVEQWKGLGWAPAAPPEPVDVLHDEHLVDVKPATAEVAGPAPQSTGTRPASGTTSKES